MRVALPQRFPASLLFARGILAIHRQIANRERPLEKSIVPEMPFAVKKHLRAGNVPMIPIKRAIRIVMMQTSIPAREREPAIRIRSSVARRKLQQQGNVPMIRIKNARRIVLRRRGMKMVEPERVICPTQTSRLNVARKNRHRQSVWIRAGRYAPKRVRGRTSPEVGIAIHRDRFVANRRQGVISRRAHSAVPRKNPPWFLAGGVVTIRIPMRMKRRFARFAISFSSFGILPIGYLW